MRAARTVVFGQSEQLCPAQQVVREAASTVQAPLALNSPGGEVRECLVFEVGDDLLDDGVVAVLGLDERDAPRCGW